MNNKEFIAQLSKRIGYKADDTQLMVRSAVKELTEMLTQGDSVTFTHLGTFEVKKRLERVITNPGTGQRMLVPPKLVVNFRPVMSAKEKLNK